MVSLRRIQRQCKSSLPPPVTACYHCLPCDSCSKCNTHNPVWLPVSYTHAYLHCGFLCVSRPGCCGEVRVSWQESKYPAVLRVDQWSVSTGVVPYHTSYLTDGDPPCPDWTLIIYPLHNTGVLMDSNCSRLGALPWMFSTPSTGIHPPTILILCWFYSQLGCENRPLSHPPPILPWLKTMTSSHFSFLPSIHILLTSPWVIGLHCD